MKRTVLLAMALAVLAGWTPAKAQTAPVRPPAHLDVSGRGSVERMPDRVIVSFSIVTNDDAATRATSANNAAYEALVAKLRGVGIEQPSIRTTGYNVSYNPRPQAQAPTSYPIRYGYVVSRYVTVTSDHPEQAGRIIDSGVSAGVTTIGGIAFTLRDNGAAYRAALAAAVADAQSQAEAIAGAGHVRLLRIVSLSATTGSIPVPLSPPRMASAATDVPTSVPPSNLTVTASVAVSYEIGP